MAFRYGNREQISFLPRSIDEYVASDDPVRAYDAFVEALDFPDLGIDLEEIRVGNTEYDPRAMLKLLVYGYSYGHRSSRKLERAVRHNLSFIWLVGGLRPDYKTISRFRREHRGTLHRVLRQCARLCLKLGLIEGNTLFVDGTKLRANASFKTEWTQEKCERAEKRLHRRIDEILSECDHVDKAEAGEGSSIHLPEELSEARTLRAKVQGVLAQLQATGKERVNTSDPDSYRIKGGEGKHLGYNGQIAVDNQNGLIVNAEIADQAGDFGQLSTQVFHAQEILGKGCECAVADAGYHAVDDLKKVDAMGISVIVPNSNQVSVEARERYGREGFTYESSTDCYICPQGHRLPFRHIDPDKKCRIYRIEAAFCRLCGCFGKCTSSAKGRRVQRHVDQDMVEKWERQYVEAKEVYRLRKEKVERPFGHIKANLGFSAFLLRGMAGVRTEFAFLATCFNLTRMVNLLGVSQLVAKLAV
jgi:transposase